MEEMLNLLEKSAYQKEMTRGWSISAKRQLCGSD